MTPTALIVGCSLFFHLCTAILAVRLIKITGHKSAWVFISIAIIIQFFRRLLSFADLMTEAEHISPQLDANIALLISLFTFLGVLWIGRFFSEIQRSKEALHIAKQQEEEAHAKTEAIIAAIGDGISIHDKELRIIYQNDLAKSTFGDHLNEICYRAYKQSATPCVSCPILATFSDGMIHSIEMSMQTVNGAAVFETTTSPLRNIRGEMVAGIVVTHNIDQRKKAEKEKEDLIAKLNHSLAKVKMLTGLIPTCASCKQIRNPNGEWENMEKYIQARSEAQFSHGLCPDCAQKLYPEIWEKISTQ